MSTVLSETIVVSTAERKIKQETGTFQAQASKLDSLFLPFEELGHQYRLEEGGQMSPYFFRIQKGGRAFYLLGSEHNLPFSILHEKCQKIIKTAHCLAGEKDGEIVYENIPDILRSEDEPNWYQALPPLFQSLLQKATNKRQLVKPEQLNFKEIGRVAEEAQQYELESMDAFIINYFHQNEKPVYPLDSTQAEDDVFVATYSGFTDIERWSDAIENVKQLIKKCNSDMQEMEKKKRKLVGNRNELQLSQHESGLIKIYEESIEASKSNIEAYKRIFEIYKDLLISKVVDYRPMTQDEFFRTCKLHWQGSLELDEFRIDDEEQEEQQFVGLGARNLYWLPRILQLYQQKQALVVVVGGAHLLGKHGLLNLLKESGFKIERMNNQGIFEDYGDYEPQGSLAERLVFQTRTYDTLRNQILGAPNNSLTWVQHTRDQMEWEQWKQKYAKERPNAEKNGYGPGALMVIEAPRKLF